MAQHGHQGTRVTGGKEAIMPVRSGFVLRGFTKLQKFLGVEKICTHAEPEIDRGSVFFYALSHCLIEVCVRPALDHGWMIKRDVNPKRALSISDELFHAAD